MNNAFAIDFVSRTLALAGIESTYLQYAIEDMNNNAWEGVLDLLYECVN